MRRPPLRPVPLLLICSAFVAAGCGASSPSSDASPPFPHGFRWGSAIAPYQVEGNLHDTDWYEWQSRCGSLCSADHADDGPDFWTHYDGDFKRAAALHNNAIRLGIEWARVFPTEASFPDHPDESAVAHYHAMFASARAAGLDVMATLDHFSLPTWIDDLGDLAHRSGWEDPRTADRFSAWAGFCAARFGAEIDWWITINEPVPYVFGGWIGGIFPPGKVFSVDGARAALVNQVLGHARAFDAIHAADTTDADGDGIPARVSFAQHSRVFRPLAPGNAESEAATRSTHDLFNRWFLEAAIRGDVDGNLDGDLDDPEDRSADPALAHRLDWIALNYYGLSVVFPVGSAHAPFIGGPAMNDLDRYSIDLPKTDFGWAILPAGLRTVLDELSNYKLPILITENGLADGADTLRPRFIAEHLDVLARAIAAGIDVRGYYHWSLLDNFEWASGFCPKFGLFRVDRSDPDRPRSMGPGAATYKEIIDANTVSPSLLDRLGPYPEPGNCKRVGI